MSRDVHTLTHWMEPFRRKCRLRGHDWRVTPALIHAQTGAHRWCGRCGHVEDTP